MGLGRRAARPLSAAFAIGLFAAAGLSPASADTKLAISYSQVVGDQIPLWIALDAGYFKAQGLDVTERYLPAQEGIPALLAGQVQLIAGGGADGIAAVAEGVKLAYVAVYAPIYTFQFWAQPAFASPQTLKGQKVAVPSVTGSAYTATVIALKELGLSPSDVILVALGSAQNNASALVAGSVAAAASLPPLTYEFAQHHLTLMVDLARKKIPNVTTGLAGDKSFIAAHRALVTGAVVALTQALQRERTDKRFSEAEIKKHLGISDVGEIDVTYDFYAREVAPAVPTPSAAQLKVARDMLALKNPRVKSVDLAAMVDPRFAEAAAAKLGITP